MLDDDTPGMLRHKIESLKVQIALLSRPTTGHDAAEIQEAQSRFDSVTSLVGERAAAPKLGETALDYRRRAMRDIAKRYSPRFKDAIFSVMDATMLNMVEPQIIADVRADAQRRLEPGTLVARITSEGGRDVTRFDGDIRAWMQPFMHGGAGCKLTKFEEM